MSTSNDDRPARPGIHIEEELPAVLAGEVDLDTIRVVTGHLRACPDCRDELVEVAAGIAVMRRLDQSAASVDEQPAAPPVPIDTHAKRIRSRSPTTTLIAAAVALVFAGLVTTAVLLANGGSDRPDAKVALAPVSGQTARGSVAMREVGRAQAMAIDTSLASAPPDSYYEVWLLDRRTGKMLPVGVLPPDGHGTYRLPGSLLEGYDTVDISLQPDNGDTRHSSDSVLRADFA